VSVSVSIDLREIHELLCEECRKKLRKLIAEKVSEKLLEPRPT